MKIFALALKMLYRNSRAGDLRLLAAALLLAVTCVTAMSLFADRLQRTLDREAAEFLAADLAIVGPVAAAADWRQQAAALGLTLTENVEFPSVLLENGEMLMVAAKAVGPGYPLRGRLQIAGGEPAAETTVEHGPPPGQAWVDGRVLSALRLKLGDNLTLGEKPLNIGAVLVAEPDKRGNFYSFSPRLMFAAADLAATGVIQPGSHVQYSLLLSGDAAAVAAFRDWVTPRLAPAQRLLDIRKDRPEMGSALSRAERYLGLSAALVVLIAGAAIAMTTQRYSQRHFDATAVLRALGCSRGQVLRLYFVQFLLLGVAVSGLGCALGWLLQLGFFRLLAGLLPAEPAAPGWLAVCFGLLVGIAILFGFALPPLLRLGRVSPLRVLRRELQPLPTSGWLVYGLAFAVAATLIRAHSGDGELTAILLGGGVAVLLVTGLMALGLLKLAGKALRRLSPRWRLVWLRMGGNGLGSVGQILAFTVTLTAMAISFGAGQRLLDDWRRQLPADAANYFAMNVLPAQLPAVQAELRQPGVVVNRWYPIVRGRLSSVNGTPIQERVKADSQSQDAILREMALTTAPVLPEDNVVTAGGPWQPDAPGQVSVERKLAENLGLQLGDELGFSVADSRFSARIVNLRSVQWDTMHPNFFMVFSPGTLDAFQQTYLSSFYLPPAARPLLNGLVRQFPNVSLLEVAQLVNQFRNMLQQLTQAINLLLVFALAAGFAVLFAALQATLDQRIHEGALLRTLGAGSGFLLRMQWGEFLLLGGVAGVLAAIGSELILYVLYTRLLQMHYEPHVYLWLALPVLGALSVGAGGYLGVRRTLRLPPLQILRGEP